MRMSWCSRILCTLLGLCFAAAVSAAELVTPIAIGFHTPVYRDVPRKDVEISLKFWVEELAQSLNLRFKPIRFYDDIGDLRRDMKSGDINFLIASSMAVAQHFSAGELRGGFSGLKSAPGHLLLVVRRDAGIRTLADLAHKRVAILAQDELSEVYLETLLMKSGGKPDGSELANVFREKRSNALVHRLFFNQADVALVNRNSFEAALAMNPQVGQQMVVLDDHTFKGVSPHIGLFSSDVSQSDIDAITRSALTLGNTPRGRQVLDIYNADAMVKTKVEDLQPFWDLLALNRSLQKSLAPRKKGEK